MNVPEEVSNTILEQNNKEIYQRIQLFKKYLMDENHSIERIIDRYLLFGTPYLFENDEENYFSLKADIAAFLGVKQTQIYVVGSAKLGFSIAPHKRFKCFNEESDVDVAVIDSDLYLHYWKELYKHLSDVSLLPRSDKEDRKYQQFKDYFFKGWLRPDKFPVKYRKQWFDFFNSLYSKYGYHIAAGIYRDYGFFSDYNSRNLESFRKDLKGGVEKDG